MNIEFYPDSKLTEQVVPFPKPAKLYIPDWYKDIKKNEEKEIIPDGRVIDDWGIKRCMPFFDGLTAGYIQESWTDIYIKKEEDGVVFSYPHGPSIIDVRKQASVPVPKGFYDIEFIWKMHWLPKLPKGWSALITSPFNRTDLPYMSLTGIIDSDLLYINGDTGGNYPFFIQDGFEGIIPAGSPLYQIIPIKRESWKSSAQKFDVDKSVKKVHEYKKYIYYGYKRVFWQKKSYD